MSLSLAETVGVNVWVMHLARSDPSFAVEADYYARAVHWDDELAQRRRNEALGWQAAPSLARDAGESTLLRVRLTDAAGRPLGDAAVAVEAFAVARSARVERATLAPAPGEAPGAYDGRLRMAQPGLWELRVVATRNGERFTAVRRVEAPR
jgi:nitrogen fixation protein FixH